MITIIIVMCVFYVCVYVFVMFVCVFVMYVCVGVWFVNLGAAERWAMAGCAHLSHPRRRLIISVWPFSLRPHLRGLE